MDSPQHTEITDQAAAPLPWAEYEPAEQADGPSAAASGTNRTANPWRRRAVSALALALIALAIWYLQAGLALPLLGRDGERATAPDATGFVSFASQGIKLGAAGGAAPKLGAPAPDFTLLDLSGRPVRLSDLRGNTVVMNFWATWCGPCRKEFPELVKLYERNAGRGLVVLGVDLQENPDIVRDFADAFGARFPIVIDTKGEVASQYRLLGLPLTMFVDAEGVLRGQHVGVLTEEILVKKLGEAGFSVARGPQP